jgi:hypothetical protein
VHVHNVDRKGYAFAYNDVQPGGGEDQSGKVNAGNPVLFTVGAGGQRAGKGGGNEALQQADIGAYEREAPPPPPQQQGSHGGYDRPPPPMLPGKGGGGLKDKVKGFAGRFMK